MEIKKIDKPGVISFCISGGPATPEELAAYRKQKNQDRLDALNDVNKQTPMDILGITELPHMKGKFVGICPVCNHCVDSFQITCDECFQTLKFKGE